MDQQNLAPIARVVKRIPRARFWTLISALVLISCGTVSVQPSPPLAIRSTWVILPVMNNSQAPQAGAKLEAVLAALLRGKGIPQVDTYPSRLNGDDLPILDDHRRYEDALQWARSRQYRYGVAGSVEEWHYKTGSESEPAVGLTIFIVDVDSGKVLWSATGARSGWGRATLSEVTQRLLADFLDKLSLQ